MSINKCSLSGTILENPVISRKTGHVYERSVIEKHIDSTGQCPITGEEMTREDLIEIKQSPYRANKAINTTGVPHVLDRLRLEYDTMVLELFNLRKRLQKIKEELALGVYQHEAAILVISRLIKERDEALKQIARIEDEINKQNDNADYFAEGEIKN